MIKVAVMGHGTVGSGVAELLTRENKRICEKVKDNIELKYILDIRDFNGLPYDNLFTKDFNEILNDPEVKIVAEVMGGLNPAYDFVKQLLLAGKSVVTSNKELVAAKGDELLKIAEEKNVNFMFEASVGGGTPIIRPIAQCLAANEITDIYGILNGTTNYILNKMITENTDFKSALKSAQDNGFAERNPAADIEGHDACRKICILGSLAFGKHIFPEQVETVGITDISENDIKYAEKFDCSVKLIGRAKKLANGKVSASVFPTLVDRDNIIANVNGVYNAVAVKGDAVGTVVFYGKGAGKMPTASAVVADIIDCAKHLDSRKFIGWQSAEEGYITKDNEKVRLYVCIKSENYDLMLEKFNNQFSDITWNIKNPEDKEIAFITNNENESEILDKVSSINADHVKVMHTLF